MTWHDLAHNYKITLLLPVDAFHPVTEKLLTLFTQGPLSLLLTSGEA